jgi:hypothetical protein
VSEDQWAINGCPDDGPAMAVDAHDTVHLVWPTVVIGGGEPRGGLFYSSTRDGHSFAPRRQIPTIGSLKPSHPQIAVDATGRLMVAWDETIDGRRVAAARTLQPNSANLGAGPITRLGEGAAAVYPVLAATDKGFIAAWTAGAGANSTIAVRQLHEQ